MSTTTWAKIGRVAAVIISVAGVFGLARLAVPVAFGLQTVDQAKIDHREIRDTFSFQLKNISDDIRTIKGVQECSMLKVPYKDCPAVRGQYVRPAPSR